MAETRRIVEGPPREAPGDMPAYTAEIENMKTAAAVEQFLMTRRARQLSDNTIDGYKNSLSKMEALYPNELPNSPNQIYRIFLENSHLAPASILTLWRHFRVFWNWLESEDIAVNVMGRVSPPATSRKLPRHFSVSETHRLLGSAKKQRDRAILAVLLDTGLRVGELASMTRDNTTPMGVRVSGKTGDRIVPISPGVFDLVSRQGDETYIWVGDQGRLTTDRLQKIVKKLMIAAGFKPPKLGPHALRHTFAVQYIVNGGDVASLQRILGHANVQTTMIYTQMTIGLVARQHRQFSPMRDFTPTNKPDAPSVDRQVFVDAGLKSGRVRRAQKAERDANVLDMLAGGATKAEAAFAFGLDRKTVRRIKAREDEGIDGHNLD